MSLAVLVVALAILQLVAGTLATASAGIAFSRSQVVVAESAPSSTLRPLSVEEVRARLPLYDQPAEPALLVPEKSPLQDEVAQARSFIQEAVKTVKHSADEGKATWLAWEHRAEDSVHTIVSPQDQLNPGALYVAVATLAGSILARNRSLLLRAILPPAFLLLSLNHFLPHTARNVGMKAEELEAEYVPQIGRWRRAFTSASSSL
ncbi:hypothetical protein JCM1841_002203 [Sporobolomyces salmonicolor]